MNRTKRIRPKGAPRTAAVVAPAANRPAHDDGLHTVKVGRPVRYAVGGHPARSDSPTYRKTRRALKKIVATLDGWFYASGKERYDDHHGGGLWLHDDDGWFFVRNLAGIEWAAQFCADPKKVDALRRNAKRLFAAFPRSFAEYAKLGIDLRRLLGRKINSARRVAEWTDSICNASVPLPRRLHTGVLPAGGGVHNYPTPVIEIERFKYDDFALWVKDDEGKLAAVVPMGMRGSGDARVRVVHAEAGSRVHRRLKRAERAGRALVAGGESGMARQAFGGQGCGASHLEFRRPATPTCGAPQLAGEARGRKARALPLA